MRSEYVNELYDDATRALAEQLRVKLMRLIPEPGRYFTAIDGLVLTRWNDTEQTDTCFYSPAIGVIIQGRKMSVIGSESFTYGAMDCLVNGVDMPSISKMTEATPEKPLLAVSLNLDRALVTELAAEIRQTDSFAGHFLGVSVAKVMPDVLDGFFRLLDMLDRPEQAPFRAPLIMREIIIRVLIGPQGATLRMIHTPGSHSNQVADAIIWLRGNYMKQLQVDELADMVGMATSTFHRQFKKVTSLSPLQFQKSLRLYEAQRLMLTNNMDANNAGRAVGYGSISQFSREYKRMFGKPPFRNVKPLHKK
jgi:AraC-like DNA-binding protein